MDSLVEDAESTVAALGVRGGVGAGCRRGGHLGLELGRRRSRRGQCIGDERQERLRGRRGAWREGAAGVFGLFGWPGRVKRILKIGRRRKYAKSLKLKEFACSGLNFKRHTN